MAAGEIGRLNGKLREAGMLVKVSVYMMRRATITFLRRAWLRQNRLPKLEEQYLLCEQRSNVMHVLFGSLKTLQHHIASGHMSLLFSIYNVV
jgi:hypothetical protein